MKQKKLKIKDVTLFVYRPKISLLADITDPTTSTVTTSTSSAIFQQ